MDDDEQDAENVPDDCERRPPRQTPRASSGGVRTEDEREREARLRDHLEGVDWGEVSARLTATAYRMMGARRRMEEAKDLAQTAICQLLDPDYKDWDPAAQSLEDHLAGVVWGLARNKRVTEATRATSSVDDVDRKRRRPAPHRFFESIEAADLHRRLLAGLRGCWAEGTTERAVVELLAEGRTLPREHIECLDLPARTVRDARLRVLERARRLVNELENEQENDDERE